METRSRAKIRRKEYAYRNPSNHELERKEKEEGKEVVEEVEAEALEDTEVYKGRKNGKSEVVYSIAT